MSTTAAPSHAVTLPQCSAGWMRSAPFDLCFIGGVMVLSIAAGLAGLIQPSLFALILFLDIWLLGYHHVVSTFTRLAFDSDSFREYRFLVIHLPILVVAGTLLAVVSLGMWVLPTAYLYWQWFHYTRQSYGIERIYRRKADKRAAVDDYIATRSLYLLPLFGILYRSYQQQSTFLGMEVKYLSVPLLAVQVTGVVAAVAVFYWLLQQLWAAWHGQLALAHTLYLLSHQLIFLTGYVLIDDITTGWLVINVWHNAQYILLVWSYNNNRFKHGTDPKHWFLSTISQTRNYLAYLFVCLGISTIAYTVLDKATGELSSVTAVNITLVVFMMINFHHYIVDGIIWKVRRPALQKNLGITG